MHRYSVQLRITDEKLDFERISHLLGVTPFSTQKFGDPRGRRSFWKESVWAYAGDLDEEGRPIEWDNIEGGVRHVMSRLSGGVNIVDIVKPHASMWWCGHFQSSFDGGPTFSAEFLLLLAKTRIPLFIDNYFESAD